jgi:sporulation related protein
MTRRREAVAAVEGRCPRCGAPRERTQEYCVECGLRLPALRGAIPALRRRWVRRLGWYPGDWVWVSLLTALVAAAGAAVAIVFGGGSSSAAATTAVARTPHRITTGAAAPLPTAPEPGASTGTKTKPASTQPAPTNGRLPWPAGRNGWTIVLFSYPLTSGTAAASSTASRAAHAGLPEVGVIDSGQFSSLHPGYYVVFSGVYSSESEAEAALRSVRASGFSSAYTRQISR